MAGEDGLKTFYRAAKADILTAVLRDWAFRLDGDISSRYFPVEIANIYGHILVNDAVKT